jgi:hypothetical protein
MSMNLRQFICKAFGRSTRREGCKISILAARIVEASRNRLHINRTMISASSRVDMMSSSDSSAGRSKIEEESEKSMIITRTCKKARSKQMRANTIQYGVGQPARHRNQPASVRAFFIEMYVLA